MEPAAPFDKLYRYLPAALSGNAAFWNDFIGGAQVIPVNKGDYLFRQGEICSSGYFINKGLFLHLYVNGRGSESVVGFFVDTLHPFLSSVSYISHSPSDFEIKALEDGELIAFPRAHIETLSRRYPFFAAFYQEVTLLMLAKICTIYAVRQSNGSEELLRYLYAEYLWIINRVPDKYIARFMGISNEWYCKLKKKLLGADGGAGALE